MTTKWIGDFGFGENGQCKVVRLKADEIPAKIDAATYREWFGIDPPATLRRDQLMSACRDKAKQHCIELDRQYK